jgi:integrase
MQRPPGVTVKNGRYYLVRKNKWHPLTRVDKGEIALLEAYYALTKDDPRTMAALLLAYLAEGTSDLRANTRARYRQDILSRLVPVFGAMPIGSVRPRHVAQYLERRKRAGAAVAGNRERAVLSSACAFAMRQGWLDFNPCYGVRRNKERPSNRYVEHKDLAAQLDRAPPALYHLLAVAYLTGARQTDLMAWRRENVTEKGIEYVESKTGKPRLIEWTPTLRHIVRDALRRSKGPSVFTSPRGLVWTTWGLQSAMRRFKPGFRFRDLRPKAETDAPGVLGHTGQMQARYTRRQTVRPVK